MYLNMALNPVIGKNQNLPDQVRGEYKVGKSIRLFSDNCYLG